MLSHFSGFPLHTDAALALFLEPDLTVILPSSGLINKWFCGGVLNELAVAQALHLIIFLIPYLYTQTHTEGGKIVSSHDAGVCVLPGW